jgi:hypothetical protein
LTTKQTTVTIMNQVIKTSGNHRAFSNKSVNQVMVSFEASRENLALGKYSIIKNYCHFYKKYIIFQWETPSLTKA